MSTTRLADALALAHDRASPDDRDAAVAVARAARAHLLDGVRLRRRVLLRRDDDVVDAENAVTSVSGSSSATAR